MSMQAISEQQNWLATCPKGLEQLLADELAALGADQVKQTVGAVHFSGALEAAYRACLWSRLANRVLLPLAQFELHKADDLYLQCRDIPWEAHFSPLETIAIDFVGTSRLIDHTTFGAQRIKDAIVDRLRDLCGERPEVDLQRPDIRIQARLHKGVVVVSLDISGESLHRRGYRSAQGSAPLKENLAAALLIRAGWPEIAVQGGALLDPMCGSGTLLIEGAMLAADVAPGAIRSDHRYGFQAWRLHDDALWVSLLNDAKQRAWQGMDTLELDIRGYDANPRVVDFARKNIENAGLDEHIRVVHKPLDQFGKPTAAQGLLITNPPYGERLGEQEELVPLYTKLGQVLQANFSGWRAALFTGNPDLARETDLSPSKQYKFFNGAIPCKLFLFDDFSSKSAAIAERLKTAPPQRELSDGAQMLVNRLQKNQRRLSKWLKQSGVSCYRLYDADMPEYAAAVDIYDDAVHVQEYAAPPTISESQARERFAEVRLAVKTLFPQAQGFYKERRRQKGDSQYQKLTGGRGKVFEVTEGVASFEINLSDYLDTGLFLDHRPVRALIGQLAPGKRFLNLFCYTAAASIHAALAGAEKTLSIDMSNTYLDWARRNFELNGLGEKQNPLMRADCLEWLKRGIGEFDVIFLDPPTFSNSKKMQAVLDVQRDHGELIRGAMGKLAPGGTLIFSNNFRKFKMDSDIEQAFAVENISAEMLDPDFERNPRIHNVWKITHKGAVAAEPRERVEGRLGLKRPVARSGDDRRGVANTDQRQRKPSRDNVRPNPAERKSAGAYSRESNSRDGEIRRAHATEGGYRHQKPRPERPFREIPDKQSPRQDSYRQDKPRQDKPRQDKPRQDKPWRENPRTSGSAEKKPAGSTPYGGKAGAGKPRDDRNRAGKPGKEWSGKSTDKTADRGDKPVSSDKNRSIWKKP